MTGNSELFKNTIGAKLDRGEMRIEEVMMMNLNADNYQKLAARTINKELHPVEMEHHALHGMVGEIGEIHSIYQKVFQGHIFDDDHVKKELGDLLWFIAEYCTARGWSLSDIMIMNIKKLMERFPDGFEVDKSLNRKEGDI